MPNVLLNLFDRHVYSTARLPVPDDGTILARRVTGAPLRNHLHQAKRIL